MQAAFDNESMAVIPAFRHTYNLDRNHSPTAASTLRTGRIKKAVFCLTIACLFVILVAWVEQSAKTPNRLLMTENISLEGSPQKEDDDAVLDTFYFLGGRPIWFDATLEGRWTLFKQRLLGLYAPPRWRNPQDGLIPHHNEGSPETLMETQRRLFVRRKKGEGIQTMP